MSYDCTIVGAGPAGLALAARLVRSRFRVLIVDAGDIGNSWQNIDSSTRLVSPWWTNTLSIRGLCEHWPVACVRSDQFHDHLLRYARARQLPVRTHSTVTGIDRRGSDAFVVRTDQGNIHSRRVVCATGYYSHPTGPVPPLKSDQSVPMVHVSDPQLLDKVRSADSGWRVLIVGGRISAGQIMVACCRAGCDVTLSTRSDIHFRRSGWVGKIRESVYFAYEPFWVALRPRMRFNSYPGMDGDAAKSFIDSGEVTVEGPIAEVSNGRVVFHSGQAEHFDQIILATGYRPCLAYAESLLSLDTESGLPALHDFESREVPGLYLLGFDNQWDFRSRYLRGIRTDARRLARTIARDLLAAGDSANAPADEYPRSSMG